MGSAVTSGQRRWRDVAPIPLYRTLSNFLYDIDEIRAKRYMHSPGRTIRRSRLSMTFIVVVIAVDQRVSSTHEAIATL